jgi:hypothetical protein
MIRKILAACIQRREFYDRARQFISPSDSVSTHILKGIDDYYQHDKACVSIDYTTLLALLQVAHNNKKAQDVLGAELKLLHSEDTGSLDNLQNFILRTKELHLSRQLSEALAQTNRDPHRIANLIAQYSGLSASQDEGELFNNVDVTELAADYSTGGIYFGPSELRARLGYGASGGHHILIFARPEDGKSLLAISIACDILAQGGTVLFVENEDPRKATIMRVVSCLTGMTDEEIVASPDRARQEALRKGYSRFFLADLSPGSLGQIEAFVRRLQPTACVTNQLRNLAVRSDTRTGMLEVATTGLRNIGKAHNTLMISVTQAGDSASNKRFLEMGDVDFSNTGVPAQVDMMIGIGADDGLRQNNMRGLSFPKNKIGRGADSHTPIIVRIDKALSRALG